MVKLLNEKYVKKSNNFFLPLVGIPNRFKLESYLYWEEFSIDNYQLVLEVDESDSIISSNIYPIITNSVIECYKNNNKTYFVIDLSKWAKDIDLLLLGKYSKTSKAFKNKCIGFITNENRKPIPIQIYGILFPNEPSDVLQGRSPIEYLVQEYKINHETLTEVGEIGSPIIKENETLTEKIERNTIC